MEVLAEMNMAELLPLKIYRFTLILLHSEWPDPQRVLAMLSAIGLNIHKLYHGFSAVQGDNPQILASELSPIQTDKVWYTILYHPHQCRPCSARIFRATDCDFWQG